MNNEDRKLKLGAHVIYFDPHRVPHDALVTSQSGAAEGMTVGDYRKTYSCTSVPCVNVVWVSGDSNRTDGYGRQTERQSSISHGDDQSPKRAGNFFLWPDEV